MLQSGVGRGSDYYCVQRFSIVVVACFFVFLGKENVTKLDDGEDCTHS